MTGGADDFRVPSARVAGQADPEVAWRVIEDVYHALDTPYESDPRFSALTPGQRAAYVLHWASSEIRNGGFEQFFCNSTRVFARDTEGSADLVGAQRLSRLFAAANALVVNELASGWSSEPETIASSVTTHADELSELDDQFFDLLGGEDDVYTRIARYAAAHPSEFFTDA